ncbi:MAG: dockerin type I domain-containing protein [Patescibacteria group bacterium]
MRWQRYWGRTCLVLVLVLCILPLLGRALDVSIGAVVPDRPPPETVDATVVFQGYSSPFSPVRILKDGTQAGTITSTAGSQFSLSITTAPGTYVFTVIARDARGMDSAPTNVTLNLIDGEQLTISDIFIAPTIGSDKTVYESGDSVILSGYTVPNSTVTLTVNSDPVIYTLLAGANGLWSQAVAASGLDAGNHSAQAQAASGGSLLSEFSNLIQFSIQGPPANACDTAIAADINCDTRVNLVDFSIMLYFWQQTNPANSRADINHNGRVDEPDFSIMLFYWTG